MLQWDIDCFNAIKQCYQNHFIERCMVCSREETVSKFHKVKKGEGINKNKLMCIYCPQCLEYMQTNLKRYKQLGNIKD